MTTKVHPYDILVKLVLIGDSGVGKSSLLFRYCEGAFTESFLTTIGIDFKIKTIKLADNTIVKLQIWDTAGQERFRSITSAYYRGADGIIMVFDVNDCQSFSNIEMWKRNIDTSLNKKVPILILANKCDKDDKSTSFSTNTIINDNKTVNGASVNNVDDYIVSSERMKEFSVQHDLSIVRVSAKTGFGVEKGFNNFIDHIVQEMRSKNTNAIAKQKLILVRQESTLGDKCAPKCR